ncbi:uncharacterized protein UDID_02344 [Ustilago sp. UG-2017a]|nr:uncharacterized protein UDID_02344 [Ustilago sp. UG-2017a]
MAGAAVLRMNSDSPSRFSVSGSRKSILAGIKANSLKHDGFANGGAGDIDADHASEHAHPISFSNTDAVLRRQNADGDAASLQPASVKGRASRSNSIASRKSHRMPASSSRSMAGDGSYVLPGSRGADDSGYLGAGLANTGNDRTRLSSAASLALKKSSSNLSQSDARSIDSRRASSGNSFVNLIRNRSRNFSQTNLAAPEAADTSATSFTNGGTGSGRLRRFSSVSRKMSLKMPNLKSRSSSASIRDSLYDESKQMSPVPPVPALPAGYPTTAPAVAKPSVDGYKPIGASSAVSGGGAGSGRSRKFSRSASQTIPAPVEPNGDAYSAPPADVKTMEKSPNAPDPFAKADGLLARARSRRSVSAAPAPASNSTTVDVANRKSFLSSTTTKASGAVGTLFALNRSKSNRSFAGRGEAESTKVKPDGMASAAQSGRASEEENESEEEEEEQPPQRNARTARGRNGAAATRAPAPAPAPAPTAADSDEEEEEEESDEDDSDQDSSDGDDFVDAPLADISEGEEEGEEEEHGHRAAAAAARHRRNKSSSSARRVGNGDTNGSTGSPYKPKGTAGATRRAGPVSSTAEARARSDTSQAVRDKAARVAKLTATDVNITPQELRQDIEVARKALNLFLNSRMIEAERIIQEYADSRLYYALGYALIATIKGFMTFEPADLAIAISLCKDALTIANLLRKPTSVVSNFGRFVRGTGQSPSALSQMDEVQRHAELVYAEAVLLKAVLGIAYAGDFFAFVSEALNMRNAYGIYRSLQKYVDWAEGKGEKLDEDFKSGVYLGNGLISMILGLVPGKVLKIMEVFGYTGDTAWAMKTLSKAGQWSDDPRQTKPGMAIKEEGVRRQICDMSMLAYHLVISTFIPVNGVDIEFADKVLHYNLGRYPEGVFFLYFSGRLYSTQALAEKAISQFETARDIQKEYVQLKHICIWDLCLCNMSLAKWKDAHDQFAILAEENNWSKAVYNYGRAANLYESAQGTKQKAMSEAGEIFDRVPNLTQKIAGKSIPMEKFVARKSKKFATYNRLLLPGLEFAYVYHCLSNAPRYILCDEALVMVSDALTDLHAVEDASQYFSGEEYYDDLCLAHFLRGVCLKYIACPERHSKVRPKESPIPQDEAAEQAEISFRTVLQHGHQLKLDHWLVYFAHYELGRLYAGRGRIEEAKEQLLLVLSQKALEDRGRKGKYSLQNMVHLRANGALNGIDGSGK